MPIKKIKLTVGELLQLNVELSSEKGLLSESLPMVFKYHLSKLAKLANDEQVAVSKLRDETIKELGVETEEGISIPQYLESEKVKGKKSLPLLNPSFTKFSEDMNALLMQERDVEYEEFTLSDLKNVESGMNFPVFFKILDA